MKKLLALIAIVFMSIVSFAQGYTYVNGYTRSNGTYVQPYHRSSPDSTKLNNFSTQGNTNPYTNQPGTVNPYAVPEQYPARRTYR